MACEVLQLRVDFFKMATVAMETAKLNAVFWHTFSQNILHYIF
jgi:hypothetical protein